MASGLCNLYNEKIDIKTYLESIKNEVIPSEYIIDKWTNNLKKVRYKNDLEGFMNCIIKFLEAVIIYVSTKEYQKQTLLSRVWFGAIEDIVNDDLKDTFIKKITRWIFDIVIDEEKTWCVKKELLKVFNICLNKFNKHVRYETVKQLPPTYLLKLVDNISSYGDYDLQVTIIQTVFRMYNHAEITKKLNDIIPESQELGDHFAKINIDTFDADCRSFLNNVNAQYEKIFSIICENVDVDGTSCTPTYDVNGIWVDFNMRDKAVSWYQKFDKNPDQWELITLFGANIKAINTHSKIGEDHYIIQFKIKGFSLSSVSSELLLLNEVRMFVKQSSRAEKLISDIIPKLFQNEISKSERRSGSGSVTSFKNIPELDHTIDPVLLDSTIKTLDSVSGSTEEVTSDDPNEIFGSQPVQILSGRCSDLAVNYRQVIRHSDSQSYRHSSTSNYETANSDPFLGVGEIPRPSSETYRNANDNRLLGKPLNGVLISSNKTYCTPELTEDLDSLKVNLPRLKESRQENLFGPKVSKCRQFEKGRNAIQAASNVDMQRTKGTNLVNIGNRRKVSTIPLYTPLIRSDTTITESMTFEERIIVTNDVIPNSEKYNSHYFSQLPQNSTEIEIDSSLETEVIKYSTESPEEERDTENVIAKNKHVKVSKSGVYPTQMTSTTETPEGSINERRWDEETAKHSISVLEETELEVHYTKITTFKNEGKRRVSKHKDSFKRLEKFQLEVPLSKDKENTNPCDLFELKPSKREVDRKRSRTMKKRRMPKAIVKKQTSQRGVKQNTSVVTAQTRPIFDEWDEEKVIEADTTIIEPEMDQGPEKETEVEKQRTNSKKSRRLIDANKLTVTRNSDDLNTTLAHESEVNVNKNKTESSKQTKSKRTNRNRKSKIEKNDEFKPIITTNKKEDSEQEQRNTETSKRDRNTCKSRKREPVHEISDEINCYKIEQNELENLQKLVDTQDSTRTIKMCEVTQKTIQTIPDETEMLVHMLETGRVSKYSQDESPIKCKDNSIEINVLRSHDFHKTKNNIGDIGAKDITPLEEELSRLLEESLERVNLNVLDAISADRLNTTNSPNAQIINVCTSKTKGVEDKKFIELHSSSSEEEPVSKDVSDAIPNKKKMVNRKVVEEIVQDKRRTTLGTTIVELEEEPTPEKETELDETRTSSRKSRHIIDGNMDLNTTSAHESEVNVNKTNRNRKSTKEHHNTETPKRDRNTSTSRKKDISNGKPVQEISDEINCYKIEQRPHPVNRKQNVFENLQKFTSNKDSTRTVKTSEITQKTMQTIQEETEMLAHMLETGKVSTYKIELHPRNDKKKENVFKNVQTFADTKYSTKKIKKREVTQKNIQTIQEETEMLAHMLATGRVSKHAQNPLPIRIKTANGEDEVTKVKDHNEKAFKDNSSINVLRSNDFRKSKKDFNAQNINDVGISKTKGTKRNKKTEDATVYKDNSKEIIDTLDSLNFHKFKKDVDIAAKDITIEEELSKLFEESFEMVDPNVSIAFSADRSKDTKPPNTQIINDVSPSTTKGAKHKKFIELNSSSSEVSKDILDAVLSKKKMIDKELYIPLNRKNVDQIVHNKSRSVRSRRKIDKLPATQNLNRLSKKKGFDVIRKKERFDIEEEKVLPTIAPPELVGEKTNKLDDKQSSNKENLSPETNNERNQEKPINQLKTKNKKDYSNKFDQIPKEYDTEIVDHLDEIIRRKQASKRTYNEVNKTEVEQVTTEKFEQKSKRIEHFEQLDSVQNESFEVLDMIDEIVQKRRKQRTTIDEPGTPLQKQKSEIEKKLHEGSKQTAEIFTDNQEIDQLEISRPNLSLLNQTKDMNQTFSTSVSGRRSRKLYDPNDLSYIQIISEENALMSKENAEAVKKRSQKPEIKIKLSTPHEEDVSIHDISLVSTRDIRKPDQLKTTTDEEVVNPEVVYENCNFKESFAVETATVEVGSVKKNRSESKYVTFNGIMTEENQCKRMSPKCVSSIKSIIGNNNNSNQNYFKSMIDSFRRDFNDGKSLLDGLDSYKQNNISVTKDDPFRTRVSDPVTKADFSLVSKRYGKKPVHSKLSTDGVVRPEVLYENRNLEKNRVMKSTSVKIDSVKKRRSKSKYITFKEIMAEEIEFKRKSRKFASLNKSLPGNKSLGNQNYLKSIIDSFRRDHNDRDSLLDSLNRFKQSRSSAMKYDSLFKKRISGRNTFGKKIEVKELCSKTEETVTWNTGSHKSRSTSSENKVNVISDIHLKDWKKTTSLSRRRAFQKNEEIKENIGNECWKEDDRNEIVYVTTEKPIDITKSQYIIKMVRELAPKWKATAVLNDKIVTIDMDDYMGKYMVLFFYPFDFVELPDVHPPIEIVWFNNYFDKFQQADTNIVGCSVDSHFTHLVLVQKLLRENESLLGIKFPLIADINRRVSKAYGVVLNKSEHSSRAVFIIDPSGLVIGGMVMPIPVPCLLDHILDYVKAHQSLHSC